MNPLFAKDRKTAFKMFDERRDLLVAGDEKTTLDLCSELFIFLAQASIEEHGFFAVALAGGSTPKAIYQRLAEPENRQAIDWKRVFLFWSDERCVTLDHPDSNYRMAMEAGLSSLPILPENIFPMVHGENPEDNAQLYENAIKSKLQGKPFDLVMLGMGEDGHTASLFPHTHGLHAAQRLVVANYVPQKSTWRITFTFEMINAARNIIVYVLGKSKAEMVKQVLTSPYQPDLLPIQRTGTASHKALWILDEAAAEKM